MIKILGACKSMPNSIIKVAVGEKEGDILLKNGRILDVRSGEIYNSDILIYKDKIAAIGKGYRAKKEIDLDNLLISPGLIEGHIHIESSMMSPRYFGEAVIRQGTTTVIADPHEIANVLGLKGIEFMLEDSEQLPVDVFFMAPSCVPATDMETSGARLNADDLILLRDNPRILGLAEVMNFPGVYLGIEEVLNKIELFDIVDGHAPLLSGKQLNAYIAAGIYSDHECSLKKEAEEKLRLGMHIMIREGSAAKNLDELVGLVTDKNWPFFSLVSDDRHPSTLLNEGHINSLIKRACNKGLSLINAVRLATINTAKYFRLFDRGEIVPGKLADLIVIDESLNVHHVIKSGEVVVREGEIIKDITHPSNRQIGEINSVVDPSHLKIKQESGKIKVIVAHDSSLITDIMTVTPTIKDGEVISDTKRDILKISVWERHHGTGNVGVGFIHGFGLKDGAIASSVAHDSHNILCVGVKDEDIIFAVKRIVEIGGGLVVVAQGRVLSEIALPIAGLMCDLAVDELSKLEVQLNNATKKLGCKMSNPFMTLSFMALPVIPHLKITDKGLVDVNKFCFTSLWN